MKKLLIVIIIGIVVFLVWKYGSGYFLPASVLENIDKLKTEVETSVDNLKKEAETKLQEAQDLKNKIDDKVDKLNKTVDAVKELTK